MIEKDFRNKLCVPFVLFKDMNPIVQTVQENSRNLKSIPAWVLEIPTITRLSLRRNNISLIPTDIAQLSQLKRLDLSENQLYSIPAEVGFLTGLEILQLASNHISALPRTLGKCVNLQILDIKANKLTALPHFFTRLASLRQLDASHNALQSKKSEFLPTEAEGPLDSIWHLTSLVSLVLDGNNLQRLPANIGQLTNVERLSIASCGLLALPGHMCALVQMKKLFLSNNNFDRLPKLLGNMLLLEELDCDDTLLWDLPATMGSCTNLTRLRMSNCPLTWPLLDLVMQVMRFLCFFAVFVAAGQLFKILFVLCHQEPRKVIQFLMERQESEIHAEPLGDVPKLRVASPSAPEIYKVHTSIQGLSRFYAQMQLKTQGEFQERFDLCSQSVAFQTPEQAAKNLRAVQKDVASRAARELADETRGYKQKQLHDGFDRYSKLK